MNSSMEVLQVGSLKAERFLLGAVIPGIFLLLALPLGVVSAIRASLPWTTEARFAATCILGALAVHLLSRRLPGFRFEMGPGKLQVISGVLRRQYAVGDILGPVRLTGSWFPVVSFRVARVRHWYSLRGLTAQERNDLFSRLSAAAAKNADPKGS